LRTKLAQIEEQAALTLADFPKTLTRERLRMIIALARYLRAEVPAEPRLQSSRQTANDPDDTGGVRQ
jgi:hypothetical protein